jgi:hypothetical protein
VENPDVLRKLRRFHEVLHPRLAGATADRIAYWDGERFVEATAAAMAGVLSDSRLYLRLNDATEVWVNGHPTEAWEVRVDGETYRLSPFGFVMRGKDLFALSTRTESGSTRCILENPDSVWIHSTDREMSWSGLTARGCVQLRKGLVEGAVRLTIADWEGLVRIQVERLGMERIGTVQAVDAEGRQIPGAFLQREGNEWILRSDVPPAEVRIFPTVRGSEKYFVP